MREDILEMQNLYITPEFRLLFNNAFQNIYHFFVLLYKFSVSICIILFPIFTKIKCIFIDLFYLSAHHLDALMFSLGRKRIIMDRQNKNPYLIRYYLFLTERESFPFNVFLHKFLKGDDDEIHDHPWSYFTIILWGGYYETVMDNQGNTETYWRHAGFFQKVDNTHKHMITLKQNTPCWTLFIPFRKNHLWGFWKKRNANSKHKWIESSVYLKNKSS